MPQEAVNFVALQMKVPAGDLGFYEWSGSTIEYHRPQIRQHLGYRECGVTDAERLTAWLAEHVTQAERRPDRVREELLARCRVERVEPPAEGRVDRIVRSALRLGEETLTRRVSARLNPAATETILALIGPGTPETVDGDGDGGEPSLLGTIKEAPGNVSLETMLTEIDKLVAVRAIGLPADLFGDVAPKVVAAWRARGAVESPSHLRTHPMPLRLTLLAALLHERKREITDTLVDLLIATLHRISARAEKKVTTELVNAFKRVGGKENILFQVAGASLAAPDDPVRQVVFPAVAGGEQTLRELVHEFKTKGPVYRRTVATTLKASYTNHYRRGPDQVVGRVGVPQRQHRPPAGHRGPDPDPPVRGCRTHHLLPAGRDRTDSPRAGWRLAGRGLPGRHPRPAPGGADGLRGRHLPGAAGPVAVQRNLGGGRRPVAQPR